MIARYVIGIAIGGLLGFIVYRFIGCSSGACPLTSNPWVSTLYGMVVGGIFAGSV